jgi:demethylmenaquinone methyltransferase/2-methoxy-6-polyprenyl-1,4-benzoquinol methylase
MDWFLWRNVIKAIENAIPFYDDINETVSLGRASRARAYAAKKLLAEVRSSLVLDLGIGPGSMAEALLKRNDKIEVVGLDYSRTLIDAAKRRLTDYHLRLQLVRGCFEYLPFRKEVFDLGVAAFALRDSVDMRQAVAEASRIIKGNGRFAMVDLGKPDNAIKRLLAELYVRFLMPFIARIKLSGALEGNPWEAITPTYRELPTTGRLVGLLKQEFTIVEMKRFLAGGVLVVILQPRQNR